MPMHHHSYIFSKTINFPDFAVTDIFQFSDTYDENCCITIETTVYVERDIS